MLSLLVFVPRVILLHRLIPPPLLSLRCVVQVSQLLALAWQSFLLLPPPPASDTLRVVFVACTAWESQASIGVSASLVFSREQEGLASVRVFRGGAYRCCFRAVVTTLEWRSASHTCCSSITRTAALVLSSPSDAFAELAPFLLSFRRRLRTPSFLFQRSLSTPSRIGDGWPVCVCVYVLGLFGCSFFLFFSLPAIGSSRCSSYPRSDTTDTHTHTHRHTGHLPS